MHNTFAAVATDEVGASQLLRFTLEGRSLLRTLASRWQGRLPLNCRPAAHNLEQRKPPLQFTTGDDRSGERLLRLLQLLNAAADGSGHFLSANGSGIVAVGFHVVGDILACCDHICDGLFQSCSG